MIRSLHVLAPWRPDAPWRWRLVERGADAERTELGAGLAALAERLGDEAPAEAVLLVPGEAVLRTALNIPARSRRQLEAALPYVFEEFLAEDVDGLHLAAGRRGPDGRIPVAALRPELLEDWLAVLAEQYLEPRSARVDVDGLRLEGADLAILVEGDRCLLRTLDGGFAAERELLAALAGAACARLPESEAPVRVRMLAPANDEGFDLAQLEAALTQERPVELAREVLEDDPLEHLCAGLETTAATPELRVGAFAPRREQRAGDRRWRVPLALAAGWFVLALALGLVQAAWLDQRAEGLRERAVAVFREVLPQRTRNIVDPRRELEALVDATGGGEGPGFLSLLGAVAGQMSGQEAVQLRSVNWNAQRGDLAIDMNVPGIAVVDRFKAGLEAEGIDVTIDSATQEQQGVRARVRVGSAGAGA